MEEWKEMQRFLTQSIKQLMQQEGITPEEEEGEAVLAILMGYTLTVRNSRNIELVLAEEAHRLIEELKRCGR